MEILLFLLILFLPFQLGKHFWPSFSYVLGLKIDYLSPSVYIQDMIALPLIITWFKKYFSSFFQANKKEIIGLLVLSFINIFFSLSPMASLVHWLKLGELTLLGVIVSKNKKKIWQILQKTIPFWIVFEFILSLIQVLKQSSIGGVFWLFGERSFSFFSYGIAKASWQGRVFLRPYGTFSHPNSLAGFILVCLILVFNSKKLNASEKIALFCGFFLLILCFSRTAWLCLLILSFIFIIGRIFWGYKKGLSFNFAYLFSVLVALVMVFLFKKTNLETSSFVYRRGLSEYAIELVKKNPFFGVGSSNFIISLGQGKDAWKWLSFLQPVHNIFLLIASETGLTGLLLFVSFLVLTIRRLLYCYIVILSKKRNSKITRYRDNRLVSHHLVLAIALFAIIFTGMFDHYWLTLIQNQLLFSVVLGLAWGEINGKINTYGFKNKSRC